MVALAGVVVLVPAAVADEALDLRPSAGDQRRRLLRGEVVAYPMIETSEKELAIAVGLYVTGPVSRLRDAFGSVDESSQDAAIAGYGAIPDGAGVEAFSAIRFTAGQLGEAQELLEARPGSQWNLSRRELDAFQALPSRAGREATLDVINRQYRLLLLERWRAYRSAGLTGIAPYARRGDAIADPAAQLRAAASDAAALAQAAPLLQEALLRYPTTVWPASSSRFLWVRRTLQGRSAVALAHQLVAVGPDLAVQVERHFYVGHSYDASQTISGGLPYQDGTLVFSINRVWTEQVAGIGSEMKRAIGRRQLRTETVRRLERLRAAVSRPAPPESP